MQDTQIATRVTDNAWLITRDWSIALTKSEEKERLLAV